MPTQFIDLGNAVRMGRSRRGSEYSDDSDQHYTPIIVNTGNNHAGKYGGGGRRRSPKEVVNNKVYLGVPGSGESSGGRRRAASTSGQPQPINLNVYTPSERDRSRSRSRRRMSSDSESDRSHHSHSRHRRPSASHYYDDKLPYHLRKELDEARDAKDRERWEEQYREEQARDKAKREKIVKEVEEAAAKKKADDEALRKKILADEEAKQLKEKADKEKEEKDFEDKVKAKFRAAGYSDQHIEEILHDKKQKHHRDHDREWAIDLSRPTYIKVNRKYLSTDTLDHFHLPWEWDKKNTEYIIIKKYIDQDFQDELFAHTKVLRERKLITSGYTKETTVKLKPNDVYKDDDKMFIVRQKSKSPGRVRRSSWMFT